MIENSVIEPVKLPGVIAYAKARPNTKPNTWWLHTNPSHPFDHTLWYPLRPLMNTFANGKQTNWWHWHDNPNINPDGIIIPGDPKAFSFVDGNPIQNRLNAIRMSLGGWKKKITLVPDVKRIKDIKNFQGWRYGYQFDNHSPRFCSIINDSAIEVLIGPDTFKVFALEAYSNSEVPLIAYYYLFRDMPLQ